MLRNLPFRLAILSTFALFLLGCGVTREKKGSTEKVEVQTPVGDLNVTSSKGARPAQVGLAGYPAARPVRDEGQDSAQAHISMPFLNLKIVSMKFESDDPPSKVLDFYRHELSHYGNVKEERGGNSTSEIQGFSWRSTPDQITLSVGPGDAEHLVAVQPKAHGSKFALVYVRTSDPDESH